MGAEAEKGKLQKVRSSDVSFLTSVPHGDNPREELVSHMGGIHQGRGYHCGVLTKRPDFSGMYGGGVPGESPHTGKAMGELHSRALEGLGGNTAGGDANIATVTKL